MKRFEELKKLESEIITTPDLLRGLLDKNLSALEKDVIASAVKKLQETSCMTKRSWAEDLVFALKSGYLQIVFVAIFLLSFLAFSVSMIGTSYKVNSCLSHVKENTSFVDGWKNRVRGIEGKVEFLEKITLPLVPYTKDKK